MSVAELPTGFERDRDLGLPVRRGFAVPEPFASANDGLLPPPEHWRAEQRQFMALLVCALPDLRSYARRLAGHVSEANDLVQETCRRAIESRYRFAVGSDMRAWLCRILRNYHCDLLRRSSRETLVDDEDVQFATPVSEERPHWAMVSDDDLALALASLQPQYQRAYVLHALEGRSYGEIAQVLHVPCSTVGTRILRARLLLRAFLLERIEAQRAPAPSTSCRVEARSPSPPEARDHR
jgi:RNA polymerase sigma-70 factor (ECF subfamily)